MPGPVMLIPGTGASSLFDQAGQVIWNAVKVTLGMSNDEIGNRPPSKWIPLLSMQHQPGQWKPVRTSMEPGTDITAPRTVRTPYDALWNKVDHVFCYDWRCDVRYNAQRLNDYIAKHPAPAGERWSLIGHSQGCLVIIAASKLQATPHDFAERVQRVILVAPPVAGTMRAANPLLFGADDLGAENKRLTREAMRTWPALYQMLPDWDAVIGADGSPFPQHQQLTHLDGWVDVDDVDPLVLVDMLDRAREAHALYHGAFSYMGPWIDARVIMGRAQATPYTVRRSGDTMDEGEERTQQGDSLVPLDTTFAWGGSPFGSHVIVVGKARKHSMLCDDEYVVQRIQGILGEAPPDPPHSVIA